LKGISFVISIGYSLVLYYIITAANFLRAENHTILTPVPSVMPFRYTCWTIFVLATCIVLQSLAEPIVNQKGVSGDVAVNHTSQDKPIGYLLRHCSIDIGLPVLTFLSANYVSHAFTIRFKPGFGPCYTVLFGIVALCFPYFGLVLACRSMEHLAIFGGSPLDTAMKSGGLCTVARTPYWKPEPGDKMWCLPFVHHIIIPKPRKQTLTKCNRREESGDQSSPDTARNSGQNINNEPVRMAEVGQHFYCEFEDLETLQRRYIRIHGLCYLPRGNCSSSRNEEGDKARCSACGHRFIEYTPDDIEDQASPIEREDIEFRNNLKCQVGQYTIIRLPPDCKLNWKNHNRFRPWPNKRKYHSRESASKSLIQKVGLI
jgi:hypothetical protein